MSAPENVSVVIRGVKVVVPMYRNEEMTRAIASRVDKHIHEIESEAARVDSQVFAFRTAYDFAVEREMADREREREHRELAQVLGELEGLIERLSQIT